MIAMRPRGRQVIRLPDTAPPVSYTHLDVYKRQHQGRADPAGRAKAAAFVDEELGEIADAIENVAAVIEHHERTACGQILKADAPVKQLGRNHVSGRPRHLNALRIFRPAIFQHLAHRNPKRIFVNTGPLAITA